LNLVLCLPFLVARLGLTYTYAAVGAEFRAGEVARQVRASDRQRLAISLALPAAQTFHSAVPSLQEALHPVERLQDVLR
jgi:hypothetical protein